jgi:uncharacterized membrane protein YfcA
MRILTRVIHLADKYIHSNDLFFIILIQIVTVFVLIMINILPRTSLTLIMLMSFGEFAGSRGINEFSHQNVAV